MNLLKQGYSCAVLVTDQRRFGLVRMMGNMRTSTIAAPSTGRSTAPSSPRQLRPYSCVESWFARAQAWWWLHAGRAVVLDTETTGLHGQVCELSIIDAATGAVLFDSLIRPTCPIEPEAIAVHGIAERDLADAPTLAQAWPAITWALGDGLITAYNAPFDRETLQRSTAAAGLPIGPQFHARRWRCIMRARGRAERRRWQRLDADHRALGDAHAARRVLLELAGVRAR